eukprot:PLAT3339.65.p2 GENE.PLAT3339.65~~PLAT3339.65.p2  ORF type:complete len:511 (+),score=229.54 PLAT3339.65:32-1564(+)
MSEAEAPVKSEDVAVAVEEAAPAAAPAAEAAADAAAAGGEAAASDEAAGGDGGSGGGRGKRRRRKKKGKKAAAGGGAAAAAAGGAAGGGGGGSSAGSSLAAEKAEIMKLLYPDYAGAAAKKSGDEPETHVFWDAQPVPKLDEDLSDVEPGPIEEKTLADIRTEPYPLPGGFVWCALDMTSEEDVAKVYTLLAENYVEDDDNMFRFNYSPEFLTWALTVPGFIPDWHVGVATAKGKLVGFITGIPADIAVHGTEKRMAEINFLCVHKKLRSKRLAPVLIKEVTRRVNRTDIYQAVYTAGVVLPKPVGSCRYFHRSLNPRKLIDVGFSRLAPRMTMSRTLRLYRLPEEPTTPSIRPMTPDDVPTAHALLCEHLSKYKLAQVFSVEEFTHMLLPREGVVHSYVVENAEGVVTDMCSFYALPSSIIGHRRHKLLNAAYSYYNVATSMPIADLMQNALILAKNAGFDVFNALNLLDNQEFLSDLKFGPGDGTLNYYCYNWRCPSIEADEVGLVLL